MKDIPNNGTDYQDIPLAIASDNRWLCLAPHPDDEVIGAGGTLMLAARAGGIVKSVVVTDGHQALSGNANVDTRKDESCNAAQIMGLTAPEFLGFGDRNLRFNSNLIENIKQLIELHQPTHLILPALSEPHPDHQALALAATFACLKSHIRNDLIILYCEIGAPTQPNTLIDISEVYDRKLQAMECFASQEGIHPYHRHAQALGTLRALGKGPSCKAAEAFWQVNLEKLKTNGWSTIFPYWPLQRTSIGLANESVRLPLVTVLIRSMGRQTLQDALTSVVTQTYPNLEVIIVNASGSPHPSINWPKQRLDLRLIDSQKNLSRSEAANMALQHTSSDMALFLDDDDLIEPEHIEKLVDALFSKPDTIAAYTGTRVVDNHGNTIRTYANSWSPQKLACINYLPIHAVLFRTWPVQQHAVLFNNQLPVLEDWDFWHQLTSYGNMVYVEGLSAIYRQGLGQSMLSHQDHPHHWRLWHEKILAQRIDLASKDELLDWLSWHALSLDQTEADNWRLKHDIHLKNESLDSIQSQYQSLVDQYAEREKYHSNLLEKLIATEAQNKKLTDQLEALKTEHRGLLDLYKIREDQHNTLAGDLNNLMLSHNSLVKLYGERESHHEAHHKDLELLIQSLEVRYKQLRSARWVNFGIKFGLIK